MRSRTVRCALAALALSPAACSAGPTSAPTIPHVFDLRHDAASSIAPVDPQRGVVAPADELRLILERQLSWHGITLVEAMRAAAAGDEAGSRAWIAALVANTDDLVTSVGLVYGPAGARAFQQQWAQHTQFLVDDAAAVGRGDHQAQLDAQAKLRDYETDSGSFFDTATGGAAPAAAITAALRTHVAHMITQVEDAHTGRAVDSTALAVADHTSLGGIAATLAGAIAAQQPGQFPGNVDTSSALYCSLTDQRAGAAVLGELGRSLPHAPGSSTSTLARSIGILPLSEAPEGDVQRLVGLADQLAAARRSSDTSATVRGASELLAAVDRSARQVVGRPTS